MSAAAGLIVPRPRGVYEPRTTAKPPQNGSTKRLSGYLAPKDASWGTNQRFPPAHFKGGFKFNCSVSSCCIGLKAFRKQTPTQLFPVEVVKVANASVAPGFFCAKNTRIVCALYLTSAADQTHEPDDARTSRLP